MKVEKLKYIFCVMFLLLTMSMQGQTVQELKKQQAALEKEMATTGKMLSETKRSETATMNKLQLIGKNIKTQRKLVNAIGAEINALDREMNDLLRERTSLQHKLDIHKADYARMVRESHYAVRQQKPLLFLLSSKSAVELMRRVRYLEEFARYREQQVRKIEGTQAEIDEKNNHLRANREEKQTSLKKQQREQDNLARDERKQKQMLDQLKKKEKDLKKKQKEQQKKQDELNSKIERLVRDQTKQQGGKLTKEMQLINGNFEQNRGRLPWPIEQGNISGHFGKHQHPVYDQVTVDNRGIYFQTTKNAKARAVYEGTVTSTFMLDGQYAVIIQHGNYRTVYSGLSILSVKQGDAVRTKQVLGTIATNVSDDNKTELYFQIYEGKNVLNPELWLVK